METFLLAASLFLLLNLVVGLARVWRGPGAADRMQAVLLFGTTTVAALLLLAHGGGHPALVKVGLVFVMLAAIGAIAFVRLPATPRHERDGDDGGDA